MISDRMDLTRPSRTEEPLTQARLDILHRTAMDFTTWPEMSLSGVGIGMLRRHIQPPALTWGVTIRADRRQESTGSLGVAVGTVMPAMRGVPVARAILQTPLTTRKLAPGITAFVLLKGFSF